MRDFVAAFYGTPSGSIFMGHHVKCQRALHVLLNLPQVYVPTCRVVLHIAINVYK